MKRPFSMAAALGPVAALIVTSIAFGSTAGRSAPAKSHIVIRERGSGDQSSDHTYKGRFVLFLNGVMQDSGTTVITPNLGTPRLVGGQQQAPVFGYDNLTTKKGTLSVFFR